MENNLIEIASHTIELEAQSIKDLVPNLNDSFVNAVNLIHQSKGRLVISGIGKSAIIAQKIVSSLNSTGTPSLFLHAADALHGDVGMVLKDDIVMIISKSGDTPEIKVLIPIIKNFQNKIIALCGNMNSYLAKSADFVLNATVTEEACPNNLAPTSSTTAQMVIGDAITVCLMNLKGFSSQDFAKYHPGGALGKKLYLHISDLIIHNEKPMVYEDAILKDVIIEITKKRLGVTVVLNKEEKIVGIVTDGDLRRMLEKEIFHATLTAKDIMTSQPKLIEKSELAVNGLATMRQNNITQLVVTDHNQYVGIIHLHDLVREGII
jgi:arabinose-5-phosphate isomerase